MKILVLNYEFPPVGGGGGRASADLAKALASRGHEVQVITSRMRGLERREAKDGYGIWRVFTGRRSQYQATFGDMSGYILGAFFPALVTCIRWKPDIIHAHFAVPTGALAYIISVLTGVPYLLTVHLGDVPDGVPEKTSAWFRIVYPLTPPIWKSAATVVAVSSFTRELARRHYALTIEVVPNGADLGDRDAQIVETHEVRRLAFVGRFQPQKNLLFLVEALAQILDLQWHCILVGDGPLKPEVEKRVIELGLMDRVEMTGWVSDEEAQRRLGESDVLVMPSLSEGLPVVGVQALTQGLAIVANAVGGMTDLVTEGVNGRLCAVGDCDCFVGALRWCLEDRDRLRRMKAASWELAGRFDIRRVAEKYEKLFDWVRDENEATRIQLP